MTTPWRVFLGCTGKVMLYQHGDFSGWSAGFSKGNYRHAAFIAKGARNDDVSSIKVPPGCKAVVYQHGDFSGWSATFNAGIYPYAAFISRGARNDDLSAIKVYDSELSGDSTVSGHDCGVFPHAIFLTCAPWLYAGKTSCNEQLKGRKGAGYRGCQTHTRSGKRCQAWSSQTPRALPACPPP